MAKKLTFEQSLARLAEIVDALENDGTPLAESMKLYREGTELAQTCRKELEEAELNVSELHKGMEREFGRETDE